MTRLAIQPFLFLAPTWFKLGLRIFVLSFFICSVSFGQVSKRQAFYDKLAAKRALVDYNPAYIKSYAELITSKIYYTQRYTNLTLYNDLEDFELIYEPNTKLGLGVGATVNSISGSLSYGFKFLNPENDQGETRYLDLLTNIYTRKWVIDLFAQFYKGMYLSNTHEIFSDYPDPYYIRPDIYQQLLGGSILYLLNNQKFSYRAPFNQNERQLKSAGSFLFGGEVNYGLVTADSALLPTYNYDIDISHMDSISRLAFFRIGPSVGYAYNLVIAKKVFASLSLTLNTSLGINTIHHQTSGNLTNQQLSVGAIARFAIGYNDDRWYLGLTSVNATVSSANEDRSMASDFGVGSIRLNFVWRFQPGPKLQKFVDLIP